MITYAAQLALLLMNLFFKKVHIFGNFTYMENRTYIMKLRMLLFSTSGLCYSGILFLLSTDTCKNIGCLKIYKARSRKASIFFPKVNTAGWKDC